ncbi:hypothetical protein LCGC14_0297880 [marine sediment metagenome]|uniref:Uncharacterized protein n=1 Tax=marine sediment metagenome TaxID=412755 RepID=A0A0F9TW42_9ZZZZ
MQELAKEVRRAVANWPTSHAEAILCAADIIANLPEEPGGYRLTGEYGPSEGRPILDGNGKLVPEGLPYTSSHYLILEPVTPKFKAGDIVCTQNIRLRIVDKEGNLCWVDNGDVALRKDSIKGDWHKASCSEKEYYFSKFPEYAARMTARLAREVYSKDKP